MESLLDSGESYCRQGLDCGIAGRESESAFSTERTVREFFRRQKGEIYLTFRNRPVTPNLKVVSQDESFIVVMEALDDEKQ